ncbi:hypothetical protein [Campylobacter hyointestinalis]|uniref:DUF1574 domain-containing protein n=1 Tax=Campylobacter hyointestinalis subsp. lawsonii TaxID=91353 RepID=A0AAV6EFI2_CAMHY|nr:hypothetical protein [Campylobacter hyointestinalis]KAB0613641.1 hypothetical protein F7P66_02900 [Campylobacter hyointestinalis subsp. lawsonii]QKF68689.1 hypothetical protein CHLWT_0071 [Campylobacter hyointestinalis subsp. lawsonii]RAZ28559.1 hypothetical protein CHLT_04130 [Campylobacter hyointestinalis subsp. lawsonii]
MKKVLNYKKWVILFAVFATMFIGFIGVVNFVVDPYGLNQLISIKKFNTNKFSNEKVITRFKLISLVENNFNAIMLGTSRTGVMDPSIVDKYLQAKTYNISFPGSNLDMQNKLFLYAHHFNKNIKYLVYGIDFMAFNQNRDKKEFPEFYELEDKIRKYEKISKFNLYLNIKTFTYSILTILGNIFNKPLEQVYLKNGMLDYKNYIQQYNNGVYNFDQEAKMQMKGYFSKNGIYKNYKFSYDYLEYFKNIIQFCQNNNIKVFVYIPPMFSDHFDALFSANLYDEFELFKKELAKITNFVDFTGHNIISENKNNYWDSSHLKTELTEVIMARILDNKSVEVPKDFGVYVTKRNIEQHLDNLRKQIKHYDLNKTLNSVL